MQHYYQCKGWLLRSLILLVSLITPLTTIHLERSLVRLVGGGKKSEGRVEIYRNGHWGTVCDDQWSKEAAEVVCRMLGFPWGRAKGVPGSAFGRGEGVVWLDNVKCNGQETDIALCQHNDWGHHNCDHDEDAGVQCDPDDKEPNFDPPKPPAIHGPVYVDPPKDNVPSSPSPRYLAYTPATIPPSLVQWPDQIRKILCNGHGTPTCTCDFGYTGRNCERAVNYCDQKTGLDGTTLAQLCGPHGTCLNVIGGIQCKCAEGYLGKYCQHPVPRNPEREWDSIRCALYETPKTTKAGVRVSCPQIENVGPVEWKKRQHCIPDDLDCFYANCEYPVGWCIPTSEENYQKYRLAEISFRKSQKS